jgi:hypothetical protein
MEGMLSDERAGLCAHCAHARQIQSARGTVFWLCRLSETDSGYLKYPRLPVLRCSGYVADPRDNQGHQR